MKTKKELLLIFTRNPELGKCKTRLAAKVGDRAALDIYIFLLEHTVAITKNLAVEKRVYYSEDIWKEDLWDNSRYQKKLQQGSDLGERMAQAFAEGFADGYEKVIIIGSDMYHLSQKDLEAAFSQLDGHEAIIGPALDGGYYLLGLKKMVPVVFQNKEWGTDSVLQSTLADLAQIDHALLPPRNDVDHYEDIEHIEAFQPFLKHLKP